MTISARAAGSWANNNATTLQVTIPGGATTGDMMLCLFSLKPYSATPTIDQNWQGPLDYTEGSTNPGNGTGSMLTGFFWKIHTGSETDPTISWGTTSVPGAAVIVVFQKTQANWNDPVGAGGGMTSTSASYSATITSDPGVVAGDMCVAVTGIRDDTTMTVPTFTQTGVTFAAVTEYPATAHISTTSNDMSADACYRVANSGTSSAAPVCTNSLSSVETGSSFFIRLRENSITTVPGSFVSDTIRKAILSGGVTADAIRRATIANTFAGDAIHLRGVSDDVLLDAYIQGVTVGWFTADAARRGTVSGQLLSDAIRLVIQQQSVLASAITLRTIAPPGFPADAYIPGQGATVEVTFDIAAWLGLVGACVWTYPDDGDPITPLPELRFIMPNAVSNLYFWLELDTTASFDSAFLRTHKTTLDVAGWEYWNGGSWVSVPVSGVTNTYAGNEARFTVSTPLTGGTWYRRVRAGTH